MKIVQRLLVAVALVFAASAAVAAPQDHHDHDRGGDRGGHGNDHRGGYHGDHRGYDHGYRGNHGYYRPAPRYYGRPGPYYGHGHWARGHRYGGPRYYVNNWDYYHLRRPPYGYRWVRADNDFLLVAVTTGLILDIATH